MNGAKGLIITKGYNSSVENLLEQSENLILICEKNDPQYTGTKIIKGGKDEQRRHFPPQIIKDINLTKIDKFTEQFL
ncbi:MAG: hypothetical protein LC102_06420 [Ignavibacteriales bacterium]|jgi:hypothetical protein|nr:MAG: hypothetical protein F9K26_08460 [Ignavibacteriaceae bacterium]MBW7873307.1 hypothetical protein [Ignavibacteria bacterium]MCZ2143043.1 hypothetical protein [Ignavibacteriales bacterium]OQY70184.1 MAG: hypothetical protein B6D45_11610 [Ignavibacteriales bacterium UTCHB3]MBV6444734.1 hypothetical protein [Ignavibacteriaceae bacterium]